MNRNYFKESALEFFIRNGVQLTNEQVAALDESIGAVVNGVITAGQLIGAGLTAAQAAQMAKEGIDSQKAKAAEKKRKKQEQEAQAQQQ